MPKAEKTNCISQVFAAAMPAAERTRCINQACGLDLTKAGGSLCLAEAESKFIEQIRDDDRKIRNQTLGAVLFHLSSTTLRVQTLTLASALSLHARAASQVFRSSPYESATRAQRLKLFVNAASVNLQRPHQRATQGSSAIRAGESGAAADSLPVRRQGGPAASAPDCALRQDCR